MDEHLRERALESEVLFRGKVISLELQRVLLPNGNAASREIVRHPGAVAILPITADGRAIFVRQFRKGPDEILLEVPAGKLDVGETPATCARRELQEETGMQAEHLTPLFEFFTSPGFADEKITLFVAHGLVPGSTHLDDDEFLELSFLTRDEVTPLLQAGQIRDAKTLIAVLWWLSNGSPSL